MASKPAVTLTLAGDEKKLTEAFDRVGDSSKVMADKVGDSSKEMAKAGDRFDQAGEKTDEAERRSMGFKDTLDGLTSGLSTLGDSSLSTTDKLMGLGQAGADLAGGLTNFLLPTLANLSGFMKGPLTAAMTFVSSHPLLITIGLLAAAFVLLWMNSETFRTIVTGVFKSVGAVAADTVGWIIDRFNGLVRWFSDLPGRVSSALSSIGEAIAGAFKFGLNLAIDYLNFWIRRANDLIYGVNVINPFGDIPYIPQIPRLHAGGVFHSGAGGEGLALLKDGERVTAAGQGGGGMTVRVVGGGALQEIIQGWFNDGTLVAESR